MKLWRDLAAATMSLALLAACDRQHLRHDGDFAIVIDPTVTRASEMSFDSGDRIGVTIIRDSDQSAYISNAEFTSDGSIFSSGALWYNGNQSSSIRAYYPYSAEGEPTLFTVQSDQRDEGYTLSDFMTASRSGVVPTSGAVPMVFRHKLAKINIYIENLSSGNVAEVGILSCGTTATVDVAAGSAEACESGDRADITAHETVAGAEYNAVIPPQRAALTFYVELDDGSVRRAARMAEAEFVGGRQFTARITLTDIKIYVQMSGEIEAWGDNTDLTPDDSGNDSPGDSGTKGSVSWGGVDYPTVTLANGDTWIAANLRYLPDGKSASTATNDGSGVWYPCNSGLKALTDSASVEQYGYLYSPETAHAGVPKTGDAAVRGICPDGWHLPTLTEFEALKAAYATPQELLDSELGIRLGSGINPAGDYVYGDCYLWGSSANSNGTYYFIVKSGSKLKYDENYHNTFGASVRCVRDRP